MQAADDLEIAARFFSTGLRIFLASMLIRSRIGDRTA
jgi:hypothetical protein